MGEEVTEQLDFEPGRFFQRRIVRRKYVQIIHQSDDTRIAAKLCTKTRKLHGYEEPIATRCFFFAEHRPDHYDKQHKACKYRPVPSGKLNQDKYL
jgi:hypothetical protein